MSRLNSSPDEALAKCWEEARKWVEVQDDKWLMLFASCLSVGDHQSIPVEFLPEVCLLAYVALADIMTKRDRQRVESN